MKARLLVPYGRTVEHGPLEVHAWPANRSVPRGWEEIDVVRPPSLLGDKCGCGHSRRDHGRHAQACLERDCQCMKFREEE